MIKLQAIFLQPTGLHNTGSICYLNSLLQALASCQAIYGYKNTSKKETKLHSVFNEYIYQLNEGNLDSNISKELADALTTTLTNNTSVSSRSFGHGQESVCETFILLIDSLGSKDLIKKFIHRFRYENECINCKNITKGTDHNISINLFFTKILNVENLIRYKTIVDDYKCEKCGKLGIIRSCRLTMLSEIIVITFNVFHKKIRHQWPLELDFTESKLKYILVGQIEHFGSLNGGHYTARGLRQHNEVYLFNDMSYNLSKFEPTENTYILIYHLVSDGH